MRRYASLLAARGKPAAVDPRWLPIWCSATWPTRTSGSSRFLPLAETILLRKGDHMAALGRSLHLRHAPQPVGYI